MNKPPSRSALRARRARPRDADAAQQRLQHAGSGVLVAGLTTLFGFGSLAPASHPALFSVGITTAIGVISALALTLFVVPTLLEFRRRA